jgi:beta-xylosidase
MKIIIHVYLLSLSLLTLIAAGEWRADLGNGRYKNPVLFADYSDPDVIRVEDDFYMVASSFNCMPGIPVLHSRDLVNWQIIGHVYQALPLEKYDKPVHGQGSWAPSIRYHDGQFYVYFCTPHDGLFMARAKNPAGPWQLQHIVDVELWEDPCPFWDDDGRQAYLVRGKLRADILYLHRMSWDGTQLLDNGKIIFYDMQTQPTIEGPKFLKKDGYYYILAPAGGVAAGWQTVLRSENIYGPYEAKIVLQQGSTQINGPHQGGLVSLKSGEWWFMHFQDRDAYGRIVHLQPVTWVDGWPYMGKINATDTGPVGEPIAEAQKPDVGKTYPACIPQTSDEFDSKQIGLQWQWHANPRQEWFSLTKNPGHLRLYTVQNLTQEGNLWFVPNLLLQKFPAPSFTATTKISFHPQQVGERSGLVIMGQEWAFIVMTKTGEGLKLGMYTGTFFRDYDKTLELESILLDQDSCYLQVQVDDRGVCRFLYSLNGELYQQLGTNFTAKKGMWIGAKVGLFSINPNIEIAGGFADFDWFKVE